MIPAQFDYTAPKSLEEAVELLQANEGAKILAGGQILLPEMKLRQALPSMLVDLRKIQGLRGIGYREGDGGLRIGAMTTYAEIAANTDVRENYHALAEAASTIGDPQIRNCGTIGGNLASSDPAADLSAVALALEATINTIGPNGMRAIAADQFFVDSLKTVLKQGEIIISVDFPSHVAGTGSAYYKFKHPANYYSVCGVAAKIFRPNGAINKCCVAVTGATDRARRLGVVETILEGKEVTVDNIAAAALQANEGLTFRWDLYASGEYRAYLTRLLTEKALACAAERGGFRSR